MSDDRALVVAAEFEGETLRGRTLVDAARAAGAAWAVQRIGADAAPLRATAKAAAEAGVGLLVRIDDTRALADLEDVLAPLGERSVPRLRERLLLVVASERAGKRLRTDVPWAPSAVDVGELGWGVLRALRSVSPNAVRAMCVADDVLLPHDLLPPARLARAAETLRRRGGRLWLTGIASIEGARAAAAAAYGVVLRLP